MGMTTHHTGKSECFAYPVHGSAWHLLLPQESPCPHDATLKGTRRQEETKFLSPRVFHAEERYQLAVPQTDILYLIQGKYSIGSANASFLKTAPPMCLNSSPERPPLQMRKELILHVSFSSWSHYVGQELL